MGANGKTNRQQNERKQWNGTLTFERGAWCPMEQNKMENMMRTIKKSADVRIIRIRWSGGPISTRHFGVHLINKRENHLADYHLDWMYNNYSLWRPKMANLSDPIRYWQIRRRERECRDCESRGCWSKDEQNNKNPRHQQNSSLLPDNTSYYQKQNKCVFLFYAFIYFWGVQTEIKRISACSYFCHIITKRFCMAGSSELDQ